MSTEIAELEAAFDELQALREATPPGWASLDRWTTLDRSLDCALRLVYREICSLPPPETEHLRPGARRPGQPETMKTGQNATTAAAPPPWSSGRAT